MSPAVLVALDGSPSARAALPVARALARLEGATLHVLHVSDPALRPADAHERLDLGDGDVLVVEACGGEPAAAILAAAARLSPRAIVLAAHCGHPRPGSGLGHVAEGVLRSATAPVVVVPPQLGEAPWAPHTLLLPLDGTPASAAAVAHAQRIAHAADARIVLLYVTAPGVAAAEEAGTLPTPLYTDQPQHEWPAWTDEFRSRAACNTTGVDTMGVRVAEGVPGPEAVRVAAEERADLMLVAWHGVLEAAHAATLRAVLTGAGCPVMVVRA